MFCFLLENLLKNILGPEEGQRLRIGAPCAGDIFIKAPSAGATTPSFVFQTLTAGSFLPRFRTANCDLAFFVYKGQARVAAGESVQTVVPGACLVVPRNTWCEMRNTGTGLLQLIWTASASTFLDFFRAWSQALETGSGSVDFKAIGQRYDLEFGESAKPAAGTKPPLRHKHWKRNRQRGPKAAPVLSSPPQAATPATTAPPVLAAAQPPVSQQVPSVPKQAPAQETSRRQKLPRQSAKPPKPPLRGKRPSGRHRRSKMVYMGGRWVEVTGEGPVIAQGD